MQEPIVRTSFNVRNINPDVSNYIKVSAISSKQTIPEFLTNLCELHKTMSLSSDETVTELLSNCKLV